MVGSAGSNPASDTLERQVLDFFISAPISLVVKVRTCNSVSWVRFPLGAL